MRVATLLAIGALLLVPAAHASGLVAASSVQVEGATSSGPGLALVTAPEGMTAGELRLGFTAAHARFELDRADVVVDAGASTFPVNPTTTAATATDANATAVASRAARLHVFAWDGSAFTVTSDAACQEFSPASGEATKSARVQAGRGDMHASLEDATEWAACEAGTLEVTGSFVVVLWDIDLDVESAEGTQTYTSGDSPSPTLPASTQGMVRSAQEIYAYVRDGTMRLGTSDRIQVFVAAGDATVTGATTLRLEDATGPLRLEGLDTQVSDARVQLDGDISARIAHAGAGPLRLALEGSVEHGDINGQAVAIQAPLAPGGVRWGLAALGILLVLAVAGAAAAFPRWRGKRLAVQAGLPAGPPATLRALHWATLSESLGFLGWLSASAWAADRATRNDPKSTAALAAQVHIRAERAQYERQLEASAQLAALLPPGPESASNAIHAARAALQVGREDEAVAWLKRAGKAQPTSLADAIRHPDFARLGHHEWVRRAGGPGPDQAFA